MFDFIMEYIMPIFLVILVVIAIITFGIATFLIFNYVTKTNIKSDYIQNIETKLNIYEQSYDKFCLEDSLKQ